MIINFKKIIILNLVAWILHQFVFGGFKNRYEQIKHFKYQLAAVKSG